MSVSTSGFALRINGTCPANDVDCGATVDPYRVCCPANSFCPSQYNVNVRQTLIYEPNPLHKLIIRFSAVPHRLTVPGSFYKIHNARTNHGIYTTTADTFVASKASQDMLPRRIVTVARSLVMLSRAERSCSLSSALEEVSLPHPQRSGIS